MSIDDARARRNAAKVRMWPYNYGMPRDGKLGARPRALPAANMLVQSMAAVAWFEDIERKLIASGFTVDATGALVSPDGRQRVES